MNQKLISESIAECLKNGINPRNFLIIILQRMCYYYESCKESEYNNGEFKVVLLRIEQILQNLHELSASHLLCLLRLFLKVKDSAGSLEGNKYI